MLLGSYFTYLGSTDCFGGGVWMIISSGWIENLDWALPFSFKSKDSCGSKSSLWQA